MKSWSIPLIGVWKQYEEAASFSIGREGGGEVQLALLAVLNSITQAIKGEENCAG